MLIKLLLSLVSIILTPIIALLDFAGLDFSAVLEGVNALIHYIISGFDIVFFFVPKGVALACANVCILLEGIYLTYCICMWVFRKIPFLGVE